MVQIATPEQHQVLAFVNACSRFGYRPAPAEVVAWLVDPEPWRDFSHASSHVGLPPDDEDQVAEWPIRTYDEEELAEIAARGVDHLVRIGWLATENGLRLTRLGEAMLSDAEAVAAEETAVIVLDSTDRFAYARLIGHIAGLGESFLVDPYFRLPQLRTIAGLTQVRRVLISKQHKGSRAARAELAVALAALGDRARLEIRATDSPTLHDRVVIGENGEVFLLGASLNTVGTADTVFMRLRDPAAAAVVQHAEDLWRTADPVA